MLKTGPVGKDLSIVRNVAPLRAKYGSFLGVILGGFDMWCQTILKFSIFGTVKHGKTDAESTGKAADYPQIEYPKPDGKLSFDRLTNVSFSGTNHAEGQPVHLKLADSSIPVDTNLPLYSEPAQKYCPAGVYEMSLHCRSSTPMDAHLTQLGAAPCSGPARTAQSQYLWVPTEMARGGAYYCRRPVRF